MSNCARRGLKLFLLSASLILSIALLAAACGGGDDDGSAGPVSFDISMSDTIEPEVTNFFELNEFTVSPGQEVTFIITNEGTSVHNMRVDGGDGAYDTDDDTVSDPDLFQAEDTGTLVWTAPDQAGEIIFRCDFHPLEMDGAISVE